MADPSGSGEPVPAPTTHDAARLAAERVEREVEPMLQRLIDSHERIDFWDLGPTREAKQKAINDVARDIKLYVTNALIPQYQALGSARPPLPPQEISPAHLPLYESVKELVAAMHDYSLDVDEPPPFKHRQMMERAEAALRVRGEPSREPTLEEIEVAESLENMAAVELFPHKAAWMSKAASLLRARLSSPEAPPESRGSVPSPTPTKEP